MLSTVWAEGGKGGEALAREVVRLCEEEKAISLSPTKMSFRSRRRSKPLSEKSTEATE